MISKKWLCQAQGVCVGAGPHNPHMETRGVDGQGLTGQHS